MLYCRQGSIIVEYGAVFSADTKPEKDRLGEDFRKAMDEKDAFKNLNIDEDSVDFKGR